MTISSNDVFYQAEIIPPSIEAMAAPLCEAYGVGRDAFGDKGNLSHNSGYHRSRRWILQSGDSKYGPNDYSVRLDPDKHGDENWVSAFDFTPGVWGSSDNRAKMIQITKRMRAAAKAGDPRVRNLREFAGTEDGVNVVTIDMQTGGDRDPFDPSHLDHCHGSFYRERAAMDHSGIVQVMLGISAKKKRRSNMFIINDPSTFKGITQVAVEGGASAPNGGYLQITNDTGIWDGKGGSYALRIAAKPFGGSYVFINDTERVGGTVKDGVVTLQNGQTVSWKLPKDTRNISITRVPVEGQTEVYDGPLSGTVEML